LINTIIKDLFKGKGDKKVSFYKEGKG